MNRKNADILRKENAIMFSVIIPNYNSKEWFSRLIKSIEEQTYKDYEVIVVDDISTDGSYEMYYDYIQGKDNWTLIRNSYKRYNGGSRNEGVRWATGKYLLFVDCDDYFYSRDCFKLIAQEIELTKADLIRLPYHYLVQQGEGDMMLHEDTIPQLMKSVFVAPWTKCVKRELFKPFPEYTLNEDVSQHIEQIDQIESIGYVSHPICVWNCRNKNQVSQHEENPFRKASYWRQIADLEILELKHDYAKEWKEARLKQYYQIAKERLGLK